ncbi:D-2-hydroxyacid dehydrogenase [Jeotgalibacillus soli]|uniref:3-phosphoglycerate dehydrogenase n=1 Tax=Jeotgalibacillus soli TaxID=889306 RepID=A0A0C2VEA5_9BACL|nr:D-2-hydroxyacid dehydrogenase [Jeotgalibacillus soli]KIL47262.1 3-phosphoglycerate dehydrogenase [Jeotgalibacillus soli]
MKILFSFVPNNEIQKDLIEQFPDASFSFRRLSEAGELVSEAEIFVTYGEDLTEENILGFHRLKWIMVVSAGLEKMPFEQIKERNILVTNARGIHAIPMSEFAFGFMLQYSKRFAEMHDQQKEQKWNRNLPLKELYNSTLLILGTGAIGTETARIAQAFGMKTEGVNSDGRAIEHFDQTYPIDRLNKPLPNADYILSFLPSTEETKHLLQSEHFHLMKESAVFINMGRGSLVSMEVLLNALRAKEIAYAMLDVMEEEPLPADHPLWNQANITITPHLSSISSEYIPRALTIFKRNLHAYLNGEDHFQNIIDLNRGY